MSTYNSIDFRASETDPDVIEIGVFHFDECAEVIEVGLDEARGYLRALADLLEFAIIDCSEEERQ